MKKARMLAIVGAAILCAGVFFAAGTAFASTEPDPLITLSYLEKVAFPKFKQDILASVNAPASSGQSSIYKVIELKKGQVLKANSACEFIVRPGSNVVCVSPLPDLGISDLTFGKELLNGQTIAINSYCVIPRGADGRGIKVMSNTAFIMIRGDYTIG